MSDESVLLNQARKVSQKSMSTNVHFIDAICQCMCLYMSLEIQTKRRDVIFWNDSQHESSSMKVILSDHALKTRYFSSGKRQIQ